jgi:hypothetical protein
MATLPDEKNQKFAEKPQGFPGAGAAPVGLGAKPARMQT